MTSIEMSLSEYKHIVDDIHISVLAVEEENARLVLRLKIRI